MESLLNRYRNITVLLLVIFAQLVLVAIQVRNDRDVPLIRVWAVTAVTPLARTLEGVRSSTVSLLKNYVLLRDADSENRRLQTELGRLKMENQFLKTELATVERAKLLGAFQARTPSRTLAGRIIGIGSSANSKVVFVDRGSRAGVEKGMAVITPDGIVGKVIAAYPTASQVLLITDPDFAAGVISQKSHVRGTLKGGYTACKVDYVPNEEKVLVGEWFYTSGDDRVFPKGFPAGVVRVIRPGTQFKEIYLEPSGLQHGLEEVLILLEGVHQPIPEVQTASAPVYLAPPPPEAAQPAASPSAQPPSPGTQADHLLQQYKAIGAAQGHVFGAGLPGSKPPDFNLKLPVAGGTPAPVHQPAGTGAPADAAKRRSGEAAAEPAGSATGTASQPGASTARPNLPESQGSPGPSRKPAVAPPPQEGAPSPKANPKPPGAPPPAQQ